MRKRAVVANFNVLYTHLPGGTEQNQEEIPQSGLLVSGPMISKYTHCFAMGSHKYNNDLRRKDLESHYCNKDLRDVT